MRVWLIYTGFEAKRNSRAIELCKLGASKRGIELELKIFEDMTYDNLPDAAIMRAPSYEAARLLEAAGVRVYNNSFLKEIANDKHKTYEYLKKSGCTLPETYLVTEDFTPPFYPIVLKPAAGHGGRDVEMIKSFDEYRSYTARVREKCVAQRPVTDLGRDLRVYVVGGKIVLAMLRISDSDFRSNFCLGGRAERYSLSEDEKTEVMKIASKFDIDYAGLDFIFDKGKIIFNEIEDAVGARMVYTYTDVDIIGVFLDHVACTAGR